MGPIEIIMRLAGRFGFAFDGVDVEASTDQMIEKLEDHRGIGSDQLAAHETSIKRTPFTSDVPFRQKAMSHMGWRDFFELMPQGPRFVAHTNRGQKFWKETFQPKRREISDAERADLVAFIKDKGALDVGFVPDVDPRLVFAGQVLPERHAIVFSVEMDKEAMETSPSAKSSTEVMRRYADLGAIAAATCDWLRERGISPAQACLLTVAGDSMAPTLGDGDLVMIDERRTTIRNRHVYAFVDTDGTARVKRLDLVDNEMMVLTSDNPIHATETRRGPDLNRMRVLGEIVWSAHAW